MSFDKDTRNALAKMVTSCRRLLTTDITDQLRGTFGLHPDGTVLPLADLTHLTEDMKVSAQALRELLDHFAAGAAGTEGEKRKAACARMVLEIAFTTLNRLAALRLCEERELVLECVRKGMSSDGFRLYESLSGGALGTRFETYRAFLESLYDELAVDLGVLFDRTTPQSGVFPTERCLEEVLDLLNDSDLAHLWTDDETIGWVYQCFNSDDDRRKARYDLDGLPKVPQNSRELAIRNQFFTPRYVVEFLTDNTLGRIWYEMREGVTRLVDECRYLVRRPNECFLGPGEKPPEDPSADTNLTQEEMLRKPVRIPHRPKKDPRDIKILDPACGSGHFLLYCFDLLLVIYEEAWADDASPLSAATGKKLREDYPSLDDLRRAVPELIMRHNLHGIDIDPRCAQIAALALWLRAQRAFAEIRIKPGARPRIRKSNIVVAEPMPGEEDLLKEFTATLQPKLLGQLVEVIFVKMKLAGEAGALLKIEEELTEAIAAAKQQWVDGPKHEQELFFFAGDEEPRASSEQAMLFDVSGVSDTEFWKTAERLAVEAIHEFARHSSTGAVRRKLFSDDAERGFAFVDACRRPYDVILMNPPFGDFSPIVLDYARDRYARTKNDFATAFVERATELVAPDGYCGWISSRTWIANALLETFRSELLYSANRLRIVADLGIGVLDALVETACCVLRQRGAAIDTVDVFRLLDSRDKGCDLLQAIQGVGARRKQVSLSQIRALPRKVFGYWLPPAFLERLSQMNRFEQAGGDARQGLATTDDFRFLRALWEVQPESSGWGKRWVPFAKGGEYEPYYDDVHLVIDYANDGRVLKTYLVQIKKQKHWSRRIASADRYGKPGLTYPERTTSDFSPRPLPAGCIFSATGQAVFCPTREMVFAYLGLAYSRVFKSVLELFVGGGDASECGSAARHYTSGILNNLPLPGHEAMAELASSSRDAIRIRRNETARDESSIDFVAPVLTSHIKLGTLPKMLKAAGEEYWIQVQELLTLAKRMDDFSARLYGIEDDRSFLDAECCPFPLDYSDSFVDEKKLRALVGAPMGDLVENVCKTHGFRRAFTKKSYWANRRTELVSHLMTRSPRAIPFPVGQDLTRHLSTPVEDLISYCVGVALGRWDVRGPIDHRNSEPPYDPLSALPSCSPGILVNDDGLPATRAPDGYPVDVAWDGLLADDPSNPVDVVRRILDVLRSLWRDRTDALYVEMLDSLGVTGSDLRPWIRSSFFEHHLGRHTRSRRKAPMFWPLSTQSGEYTLWVYYHRLTDQTLYTAVNKFLEPKIEDIRRAIAAMERGVVEGSGRAAAKSTDRITEAQSFLSELSDLREELLRVAGLPYTPNLNDGVIINAAPLHRLFRHRQWAKDTEAVWKKLEKGEYDWSHMAYSIWPDRVKNVCKKDLSIAIAHGLEELYEGPNPGEKKKRKTRKKAKTEAAS